MFRENKKKKRNRTLGLGALGAGLGFVGGDIYSISGAQNETRKINNFISGMEDDYIPNGVYGRLYSPKGGRMKLRDDVLRTLVSKDPTKIHNLGKTMYKGVRGKAISAGVLAGGLGAGLYAHRRNKKR